MLMLAASDVNENNEQVVCIACGFEDTDLETVSIDGVVTSTLVKQIGMAVRITWDDDNITHFSDEPAPDSILDLSWGA